MDMGQKQSQEKLIQFARCRCFLESNVFLKRFGLHVTFKTVTQFTDCYGKTLAEMGCTDLKPVISEVGARLHSLIELLAQNLFNYYRLRQNYKEEKEYRTIQSIEQTI